MCAESHRNGARGRTRQQSRITHPDGRVEQQKARRSVGLKLRSHDGPRRCSSHKPGSGSNCRHDIGADQQPEEVMMHKVRKPAHSVLRNGLGDL